jgi:hypothetical protein
MESLDLWRSLAQRWNGAERTVPTPYGAGHYIHSLQLNVRKYDATINKLTGTAGWELNKIWVILPLIKGIPNHAADSARGLKPWAVEIGAGLGAIA